MEKSQLSELLRRLWEPSRFVFCLRDQSTPSQLAEGLRSMVAHDAVKRDASVGDAQRACSECLLSTRQWLEDGGT